MSSRSPRDTQSAAAGSAINSVEDLLADNWSDTPVGEDDARWLAAEAPAEVLDPSSDPWIPQVGPAFDPWEDRPHERKAALQPLLSSSDDGSAPLLVAAKVQLSQGSGADKLNYILSLPSREIAVQALAPEEFVFLVKDIGLSDSGDLLALASPRQLQAAIDLDAWRGDTFDTDRFYQWLAVARHEGQGVADRFVGAQEDGVLAMALAPTVQVSWGEDELDDIESRFVAPEVFRSPDGTMQLLVESDEDHMEGIRELVESLYRQNLRRGRTVLRALRWELPAMLQEDLYELRAPRLRDMGFVPKAEALEVYQYLDPHAAMRRLRAQYRGVGPRDVAQIDSGLMPYLPGDEPVRLGLALRDSDTAGLFLQRCVMRLVPDQRERVHLGLVHLAYCIQSARADAPGDVHELAQWSRHAMQTASMGLEHLSDGDEAYGTLLVATQSLRELFGVGHGLVLIEFHRARRLRALLGGGSGLSLLEVDDAALLGAMTGQFPGVPAAPGLRAADLEDPTVAVRPIADQLELARVRTRLQALEAAAKLVQGLCGPGGLAAQADREDLTLEGLFSTALVHWLANGAPSLNALGLDDLQRFLQRAFAEQPGPAGVRPLLPDVRQALTAGLLMQQGLDDAQVLAMTSFVDAVLVRLQEEFGALPPGGPLSLGLLSGVVRVNIA